MRGGRSEGRGGGGLLGEHFAAVDAGGLHEVGNTSGVKTGERRHVVAGDRLRMEGREGGREGGRGDEHAAEEDGPAVGIAAEMSVTIMHCALPPSTRLWCLATCQWY